MFLKRTADTIPIMYISMDIKFKKSEHKHLREVNT